MTRRFLTATILLAAALENGRAQHVAKSAVDGALAYSTYAGAGPSEIAIGMAVDQSGSVYVLTSYAASQIGPRPMVKKLSPDGARMLLSITLPAFLFDDGGMWSGDDRHRNAAIAVDGAGDIYVTGTLSDLSAQLFSATPGAAQAQPAGSTECFVMKVSGDDGRVLYATLLGGSGFEVATGIAVDSGGNAFVTGFTDSADFPVTNGAFQTAAQGDRDAFVVKINPAGTAFVYATYLGGSGRDIGNAIAVDGDGNAYLTGRTESVDFPVTPSFQNPNILRGGSDAFVTVLDPDGAALLYSTYLGGTGSENGSDIALDAAGDVYVTGLTYSDDFPLQAAAQPDPGAVFVAKLRAGEDGALLYSTYLGGLGFSTAIAVNAAGEAFVGGIAWLGFRTTDGAYQSGLFGESDAFVTTLSATGSEILYSTYLGGIGRDGAFALGLDPVSNVYLAGFCSGTGFPTTPGAYLETYRIGATYVPVVAKVGLSRTDN